MFPFFVFLSRSISFLRHRCVFVFRSRPPAVFRQISPTLCPLSVHPFFLRQFFNFFVFLSRSFSFLRRSYLIVFRSSTVFRQFSLTSFAFSVVLCLSRARCFLCF